jgi:uncharacterized protein (DUF433 family)
MSLIHETDVLSADERRALIRQYIVPDPHHPGIARYVLGEYGVSVWALVAYYEAVGHDLHRVASDYDVPDEQVRAALAFYTEHADAIDAYLASRRTA